VADRRHQAGRRLFSISIPLTRKVVALLVANVQRSWPEVLRDEKKADESVLGDWAALAEAKLHQYADVILGVANGTIVAAFDMKDGIVSRATEFVSEGRPIRYLDSAELHHPDTEPTKSHRDVWRCADGSFRSARTAMPFCTSGRALA